MRFRPGQRHPDLNPCNPTPDMHTQHHTTHRLSRSARIHPTLLVVLNLLTCLLLLAAGCSMLPLSPPEPGPRVQDKSVLRRQADQAWRDKNYASSEPLYKQIINAPDSSLDERAQAWERYTLSALQNGHNQLALDALPKWQAAAPQAPETKTWQDAFLRAVKGMPDHGTRDALLAALSTDATRHWRLRAGAAIVLASLGLAKGELHKPLASLDALRGQASPHGRQGLADIEELLFKELQAVSPDTLDALTMLIPETQRTTFPNTVIELEKARRLLNAKNQPQAQAILNGLKPLIANKELLAALLGAKDVAPSSLSVALALPLTGAYGEIGSKIVRGAGVAQAELNQAGLALDVQIVNTETSDWQQNIRNLPPSVAVVGGPLHVNVYKEIAAARLTESRVFFTFLTSLPEAVEGRQAWRFFASPQDQIRALVETATGRYSIRNASILYPQDSYGQLMAQLFEKEAATRGLAVVAKEAYPPNDNKTWGQSAGRVARSAAAVFMPGDWAHAEVLVPHLINQGGENTLLLGTAIWAQTIARKKYVELPTFSRAVFPGTWLPDNPAPAALRLKSKLATEGLGEPDYWVGLGYDFIRFAAQLGQIPASWTPATVNDRIRQVQAGMEWSAAPLAWDGQGQAKQQLFMFRPTENGFSLLDATAPAPGPSPAYAVPPTGGGGGAPAASPGKQGPED